MLHVGPYSHPVHIYRKAGGPDTWGNLPMKDGASPKMPVLHGYTFSHTIEEATVVPRTTEIQQSSPENAKRNYTGKTLYCGVHEDVESDDMVVYVDYAGKNQMFEVEGEGSNDYVSPYSGIEGGKELFLGRLTGRR